MGPAAEPSPITRTVFASASGSPPDETSANLTSAVPEALAATFMLRRERKATGMAHAPGPIAYPSESEVAGGNPRTCTKLLAGTSSGEAIRTCRRVFVDGAATIVEATAMRPCSRPCSTGFARDARGLYGVLPRLIGPSSCPKTRPASNATPIAATVAAALRANKLRSKRGSPIGRGRSIVLGATRAGFASFRGLPTYKPNAMSCAEGSLRAQPARPESD